MENSAISNRVPVPVGRSHRTSIEKRLEESEAKQKAIERQFDIALAATPLRPVRMPIGVIVHSGESLMSILFRACSKIGIYGTQQLLNELGWPKSKILRPNQVVQAARSIGVRPIILVDCCPITVDDRSVFFSGHRLDKRHVTAHEVRICKACIQEEGFGRREWQLRALMVCPRHRAPLTSACEECESPLSHTRLRYDQCRCGNDYSSKVDSCTNEAVLLASIITAKFYGADATREMETLGLPAKIVTDLPLSGLLDLVCVLGMAERDPAKFQLRRLEWPLGAAEGIRRFDVASASLRNWPKGLFYRLRTVRMYVPWQDSVNEVTKTLDHILRAATHHMEPGAGKVLLNGIAEFAGQPEEWNEHRRTAYEESSCLG